MSRLLLRLAALCLAALLLAAGPASADERILDFVSQVVIRPDASLLVTETIQVRSQGRQIKRGIVREFPTTYTDRRGRGVQVGFSLQKVERDGRRESYHLQKASNGVRVYIGRKDHLLSPGVYTYRLTYRTERQLGFFDRYDELYWNVTGNGWTLPIDRARAVVQLPAGGRVLQQAAYTGPSGAQGRDWRYGPDAQGRLQWVTTRPLAAGEGLTIAVAWPKGLVKPPPPPKDGRWLPAGSGPYVGLAGLAALLLYYLLAWYRVGRDPQKGTVIPLFTPPAGLSPAAVRFLRHMGFDHKAFAAAVVDMAVKGYLTIVEEKDKSYQLKRTGKTPDNLSPGERRLGPLLFKKGKSLKLKPSSHSTVSAALKDLRHSLRAEYEKANFRLNRLYLLPGILITLLALAALVLAAREPEGALGLGLWLAVWSGGCYFISTRVVRAWRGARGLGGHLAAMGATVFAAPFIIGALIGLFAFGHLTGPTAAPIYLALLALTPLFAHLLKAPTVGGRRLMDQIEGFRLYLSVAEKERLGLLHPPERTPELFERYLSYALALDVEQEWSEQFAQVLAGAGEQAYQPGWYSGGSFSARGVGGLAGSLGGALTGAISSSSSAPGSSSGSGGGGSSGGGGGGGGGSGW
ncbi:MAG: DUF2207 domain-containing protein [Desulfarculus sp.]|nr:MAG: DUF2207 domain-containing protein [Desulfarculus sp.]